jgi:hypothetical protein
MNYHIVLGQGGKRNLLLESPLIAGSDTISAKGKTVAPYGALLTPVLSRGQTPVAWPAFVRTSAGYLLSHGYGGFPWQQGRQQYRTAHALPGMPIIAAISPVDASEAYKLAQALGSWEQIEGIALNITDDQTPEELAEIIKAVNSATDLPLLIRLPFGDPQRYAEVCRDGAVAALIATAPPQGEVLGADLTLFHGELHSPALVPFYAHLIRELKRGTELPILARADAHSTWDVLILVAAGAEAVILEGALWVQPHISAEIQSDLDVKAKDWQVDTWQAFCQHLRQKMLIP